MHGAWYGQWGIKRGDVIMVPNQAEAKRLRALGHAEYGRVALAHLGIADQVDDQAALDEVLKEHAANVPEESRPNPFAGKPVGAAYRHRFSREGWSV
jgi:hypothetical protein